MKSRTKRALSILLTIAMMATLLVVPAGAATEAEPKTYTLDISTFGADVTSDSLTKSGYAAGTDKYYTLYPGTLAAVESGKGSFNGYTATKLYCFGGNIGSDYSTRNIKFTTKYPNAEVKIWWQGYAASGSQTKKMPAIIKSGDKATTYTSWAAASANAETKILEVTLEKAQEYMLVAASDGTKMAIYKIEVTETKPATYDITGTATGDENATVTFKDAAGETITEAAAGTKVTVVAEGTGRYVPKTYSTDDAGTTVAADEESGNQVFTMPAKNITVTVAFEEESLDALFAAARAKLTESVLDYTVAQATVNTADDVKANVEAKLEEALTGTGVTAEVTQTAFTAATGSTEMDATEENNGKYEYSVALKVGTEGEGEGAAAITGTVTIEATTKPYTQDTLSAAVTAAKAKLLAYGAGKTAADVFTGHIVVEPATMDLITNALAAAQVVVNKKGNATADELKTQTKALNKAVADFETAVVGKTEQGTKTDAGLKVLTGDALYAAAATDSANWTGDNSDPVKYSGKGNAVKAGTDDYFTVKVTSGTKLDKSDAGVFSDGYAAGPDKNGTNGRRINLAKDGATDNCIKFTVTEGATANVRVYWVSNTGTITMTPASGTAGGVTAESEKNIPHIATWTGVEGGKEYAIYSKDQTNYIFRVEVQEILPAQASTNATFDVMAQEFYDAALPSYKGTAEQPGKDLSDVLDGALTFTNTVNGENVTVAVSGKLPYVTGFVAFNSTKAEEQEGNYLPIMMVVPEGVDPSKGTLTLYNKDGNATQTYPMINDSNHDYDMLFTLTQGANAGRKVFGVYQRLANKNGVIKYTVDWDGEGTAWDPATYTLDLTDLTLALKPTAAPKFAAASGDTPAGNVYQVQSKADKKVVFTLAEAPENTTYKLYKVAQDGTATQLGSNAAVTADTNKKITFTLTDEQRATEVPDATADSTDVYTWAVKATTQGCAESEGASVTVNAYIPVVSVGLTHLTEDGHSVAHVLYEKMANAQDDVIGGPDNQTPDHPNGWKLVPTVKGPGTKTPTNQSVTISNARGEDVYIHVDDATKTVTAVKGGGAGQIRVTSAADEQKYAKYDITVKVRVDSIAVTGTGVTDNAATLAMGSTLALTATVTTSASGTADHKLVKWTSSDSTVASVNATTGVVTPVSVSATPVTITATSTVDETVSKSVSVTVGKGNFTPTLTAGNSAGYTGTAQARFKLADVPEGAGAVTFTVTKKDGGASAGVNVTELTGDDNFNYQIAALPAGESSNVTYTVTANFAANDNWNAATATVDIVVLAAGTKNIRIVSPGEETEVTATTAQTEAVSLAVEAKVVTDNVEDPDAVLTYAWTKGGTAIQDASAATYAIPTDDLAAAGELTYVCTISSDGAADKTVTFTVKITDPALEEITVTPGAGVTYDEATKTVTITGANPATFTVNTTPTGHKDTVQVNSTVPAKATAKLEGATLTITPVSATSDSDSVDVILRGTTETEVIETIHVKVVKAAAPAELTANDYTATYPTAEGGQGSITITQTPVNPDGYMYKAADAENWTRFPEGNTVELDPGSYKIRVRVPFPELQETTNGLVVTIPAYTPTPVVARVVIQDGAGTVKVGGTITLQAQVHMSNNTVSNTETVKWTSSDPSKASVNEDTGVVTGVAAADSVTITATSVTDDTKSDTKTISVTANPAATKDITFTVPTGVTLTELKVNGEAATLTAGKLTVATDAVVTFKLTVASGYTLGAVSNTTVSGGVYTVTAGATAVVITATAQGDMPSGGSTVTGGGSGVTVISGGNKSETVVNEDGSKTTTTVDKDGNKTIVTEGVDGAKTEIVSKVDGEKTIKVTDAAGEELVKVEIPATVPAPEAPFVDVPEDHWAKEAIDTIAGLGLVKGVDDVNHIYDMTSNITRGALASVLHRFSNGKAGLDSAFTDVATGAWYTDGVAWAAKVGVVTGYENGTFGPDNAITRQELAVMLYRYAKLIGMDVSTKADVSRFNDSAAVASWAKEAMTWCTEAGIVKGVGGNTLNPEGVASRAECAVMLSRFIDLV